MQSTVTVAAERPTSAVPEHLEDQAKGLLS